MELVKKPAYPRGMVPILLAVIVAASDVARPDDAERLPGAVIAPAVLPPGASAANVMLGAPAVGASYRHGLSHFELEGRFGLDYFQLQFSLEAFARVKLFQRGIDDAAATVGLGLVANTGARYLNPVNAAYIGLRPSVGAIIGLRFSELVTGLWTVDFPGTIPFSGLGGRVSPTTGLGAEIHLGGSFSLALMAGLGVDVQKPPLGVVVVTPAWFARMGVGYRFF